MKVPVASKSASRAVTSPEISGSGLWVSVLVTAILTREPIFTPALDRTSRLASRKRRTNMSGRFRLSSTYASTSSCSISAASGLPSIVMTNPLLTC